VEIQDIISLLIAFAAAAYIFRTLRRALSGHSSCHCDASRPDAAGATATNRLGLKRTPLITLDQVGKPESDAAPTTPARP